MGSISYQRSSEPPPPATPWAVQTSVLPVFGSMADTACSRRASSVSSRLLVLHCWAEGGVEYEGTVTEKGPLRTGSPVDLFLFTLNTVMTLPLPSGVTTTHPEPEGSACWAGSGALVSEP